MRLADLIGSRLVDTDGRDVGRVGDVWLIQNGPPIGVFGCALIRSCQTVQRGFGSERNSRSQQEHRAAAKCWLVNWQVAIVAWKRHVTCYTA